MADKRARGSNFTSTEKTLFLDVLTKYIDIIENKKTDGVSLKKKEEAWCCLENDFNSHHNVTRRNVKQLKSFYDNFKRKSKKNLADDKVDSFRTGDGTFTPRNDDENLRLLALLKDQIDPLPNSRDSDANYHQGHSFSLLDATASDIVVDSAEGDIVQVTYAPLLESSTVVVSCDEEETAGATSVNSSQNVSSPGRWISRNRPAKRRRESDSLAARKSVAELADQRKQVVALESDILKDRAIKDNELRALKVKVQEEKLRAYQAKRTYYEKKLEFLNK